MLTLHEPRHQLPPAGGPDRSALARQERDQTTATRALQVLAQTDWFEPSRRLYREMLLAGSLRPQARPSIPAARLIAREYGEVA